jgi:hypothetical protein
MVAVIVTARSACGNPVRCRPGTASGLIWAGAAGRAIMGEEASFRIADMPGEMMNPTTIPVTIAPEAAERVAELGMQRELERMLDFLRQEVPGVLSVAVQLALPYDTGDETSIVLEVPLNRPFSDASGRRQIRDWMVAALPPVVNRYFTILTVPGPQPRAESLLPEGAMNATGVPVTITPEAAERVAELGMQREFERILDYLRQKLPGVRAVEAQLRLPYDTGYELGILVRALLAEPFCRDGDLRKQLRDWRIATFPPEVGRYFSILLIRAPEDAR